MADDSSSGWGFFIFILLAYAWYQYQHENETTVYFAYCNAKENAVCVDESSSNKATYKASFDNQTVVTWGDLSAPQTLKYCVVGDAKNWKCHAPDDPFADTFAMADGEYSHTGRLYVPFVYAIGAWKWRWLEAHRLVKLYLTRQIK